jgi:nicotinamidase-related amidase
MDRLSPESSVLIVVDVQDRLAAAMPKEQMARLVQNVCVLLEAAKLLQVPVLASEQYPRGLGSTVAALSTKLGDVGAAPIAKIEFSACDNAAFVRALDAHSPRAAIVVGMETHVCVFQTARDLVRRGYVTHVVADAVASRRDDAREIGLSLCQRAGAVVTSTEAVAFDWLRVAGTDAFRAISALIR